MRKRDNDPDERTSMGSYLRTKRHVMNLTQENVANLLGISITAYSKLERGESSVTMDRLKQICKILDIDVKTLVEETIPNKITLQDLFLSLSTMSKNIEKISTWIASEKPQIYKIADIGKLTSVQDFKMSENTKKRIYKRKSPKSGDIKS